MGTTMSGKPRQKTTVSVIEHHPLAARYLEWVLCNGASNISVTDVFSVLPAGIRELKPCSICLIDRDALPAPVSAYVRSLRTARRDLKILVIGSALPLDGLCRLLLLGVQGYVLFEDVESELLMAIDSISHDRLWAEPEVIERFAFFVSRLARPLARGQMEFTEKESLVLGLLQRRLTNKEISTTLSISERTVRFHLANIFAKMGVHDRHTAAELARSGEILPEMAKARIARMES